MPEVPNGYTLSSYQSIAGYQVEELFEAAMDDPIDIHSGSAEPGHINESLGVRDKEGNLVAYGGLDVNLGSKVAIMYGLAVNPRHRYRGIGTFLIQKRVEIAILQNAEQIVVDWLIDSNYLLHKYLELGFTEDATDPGRYVKDINY